MRFVEGRHGVRAVFAVLLLVGLAGCDSDEQRDVTGVGSTGSCATAVRFRGHTYLGYRPAVLPVEGEVLGTATVPTCDASNEGLAASPEEIEIAELPGVSPDVAVLWADTETLLVREDVDPLPPEIAQLMRPPDCRSKDVPIELSGQWRGILGADGTTELDLVPPYDVDLFVATSSAPQYERAFLSVRVRPELGMPLSRDDVRTSLWQGGTISIVAGCDGENFVARTVEAFSP